MKINQVEELTGITKKNIRFYEDQGLLSPKRNSENGYRDYGEEEVAILLRIRLLRKLDVPIEEIRDLFNGPSTLGDGMRRHMITLERAQRNLQSSLDFCRSLQSMEIPVRNLDAAALLQQMEEMEAGGTTFADPTPRDVRRESVAPIIAAAVVVTFVLAIIGLILWAVAMDPNGAPPWWFLAVIIGLFVSVALGAVAALNQRLKEIRKGEIEDARYY